jgi:acyl-CoA thioesterase YciA
VSDPKSGNEMIEAGHSDEPAIRMVMMPRDTNAVGTIFGGHILSIIDQAGAIGAHRLGLRRVVTVAMKEVVFKQPVKIGDLVSCYASVAKIGRTSVTVHVRVIAHSPSDTRTMIEVTEADVVYVHVDEHNRPVPIKR